MYTLIIGDIHGCNEALQEILDRTSEEFGPDRTIIVAGDAIHKGPSATLVLDTLQALGATLVLGNHELQQLNFMKALKSCKTLDKVSMKNKEMLADIQASLSPENIAYIEAAPLFVQVPGGIVVHGGIPPLMESLPTARNPLSEHMLRLRYVRGVADVRVTVEIRGNENLPSFEGGLGQAEMAQLMQAALSACVLRKTEIPKGSFLSLGDNKPGDPFHADIYNGRFGFQYFGHTPHLGANLPEVYPHAAGLDLGCVFGGRLGYAVLLNDGTQVFGASSVQPKYATPLEEE